MQTDKKDSVFLNHWSNDINKILAAEDISQDKISYDDWLEIAVIRDKS